MQRTIPSLAIALALSGMLTSPAVADEHLIPTEGGALNDRTVILSPGHGYQRVGSGWGWQRPLLHQIREDIHTNEIMIEVVQRYLAGAGARVEFVRERSFQTNEVIVDQVNATSTGAWTASTANPRFYGTGYRATQCSLAETATYTFTPTIPEAGRYPVYVWFTQGNNRSRDALYTVHHTGGTTQVRIRQDIMGDHWRFLGDFHFAQGTAGKVVLSNQGSDPTKFVIADGVRFGGGIGPSGQARWREGALAFVTHKGYTGSTSEVTIRPRYGRWLAGNDLTRWRNDFRYVALHTNAGGGTGTVCFSYGDGRGGVGPTVYTNTPSSLRVASDGFARGIQRELIAAYRAEVDPAWRDRGTGVANFGELRESRNMPSTLIELAFHDSVVEAAHLRSARFRHIAGRAIYKGVLRSFDPNATVVPLPPARLRLENLGQGEVRVSWDGVNDPTEPSAGPTGFKVYTSPDGFGFDNGRVVTGGSVVLDGLTAGETIYVKVTATNAGGEGLATRVGGALVNDPYSKALVVDGFDRTYSFDWVNGGRHYTYDYAVEHVEALAMALPGHVAIDYAENEAAGPGGLALGDYRLVDWLLGRESSADRTFDSTEQAAVEAYLSQGGRLLVSGSEIGWDLDARSGGKTFFNVTLGASYVRDDAGTQIARGAPGSPFAAVPTLDFGSGRYLAATPDVLAPAGASVPLVAYETGGAPVAGVGRPKEVVVLGFPLEALGNPAQRVQLTQAAVAFLDPDVPVNPLANTPVPVVPTPGGTAPTTSTTTPGSTANPTASGGGRRGGGGGCSLETTEGPVGAHALLLLCLALLPLRRRAG